MLWLAACETTVTVTPRDEDTSVPPPPTVSVTHAPAMDPVDGAPVEIAVEGDAGEVSVDVGGRWMATLDAPGTLTWDGRDNAGSFLPAAVYPVTATRTDGEAFAESQIAVVRTGFVAVYAEGDETQPRIPLYWTGTETLQDEADAISSLSSLEDADGVPLDFAAVGTALDVPAGTEPVAFAAAGRPILSLVPGESVVVAGNGLDVTDISVAADGWTVLSGVPMRTGVPVVMQKDAAIAETLDVVEETLELRFSSGAEQVLPLRFYALVGPPTFDHGDDVYSPWVLAIDPLLRDIAGTPATHDDAIDATRDWIYAQSDLRYDTQYGASAYTEYIGNNWTRGHFYFGAFLARRWGNVVNCTDCASILTAYANMLGAELHYAILLENFSLNQILAIGGSSFSNCPFGPGGCGFSYHAVTADDDEATRIWDATLSLDGDEDPTSLPGTELPVHGVPGEEYLDRLVLDGPVRVRYHSQGTLQ